MAKPAKQSAKKPRALIGDITEIAVDLIDPNPHQVRTAMNPIELGTLATSIERDGLLAPVLVQLGGNFRFVLVAGSRRLEAHKLLERETISAIIITDAVDPDLLTIVENVVRESLSPVDMARALKLLEDRGLDQERVGDIVGMGRSDVAKTLKILDLPETILAGCKCDSGSEPRTRRSTLVEMAAAHASLTKTHGCSQEEADEKIGLLWEREKTAGITRTEIRDVKMKGPAALDAILGAEPKPTERQRDGRTNDEKARDILDGKMEKVSEVFNFLFDHSGQLNREDVDRLAAMVKRIYNIMAVTRGTGPRCTCPDPLKCEHAPICDHAFPFRADGSAFAIHESMTASVGWLKSLEGMAAKIDERDCRWLSEHQDAILNILSKSPSAFPPLICEHAQTCEYKWRCRHARPFYEWTSSCQRVDLEEQPKSVVIASGEAGPSMYLTNEKYVSAKLEVISRYLGMLSYSEALFDHARMAILAIKRSVERIVEKKLTPPSIICGSASTCDLTENCPNAKPLYEWDASNCRRSRWDGRPLPKPVSCQGGV